MKLGMELNWTVFRKKQDYENWLDTQGAESRIRAELESAALEAWHAFGSPDGYLFPGLCPACGLPSTFEIDRSYGARFSQGIGHVPNWRERLVCTKCNLNARVRTSAALIRGLVPETASRVWLAEQVTPLHRELLTRYPFLIGSEYLGPTAVSGSISEGGLRHEDCCASSFQTASLDAVCSFDVLEHVPNYRAALRDAVRVLRPGGLFIWTAPFDIDRYETLIRATVEQDGSVTHLEEPDFHGDPVNPEAGILCFQYFGWDILDEMRTAGFRDSMVYSTWSMMHGLIGPEQRIFVGRV
jgi:Methyltransferase domain